VADVFCTGRWETVADGKSWLKEKRREGEGILRQTSSSKHQARLEYITAERIVISSRHTHHDIKDKNFPTGKSYTQCAFLFKISSLEWYNSARPFAQCEKPVNPQHPNHVLPSPKLCVT
jgi:hypothetical protein